MGYTLRDAGVMACLGYAEDTAAGLEVLGRRKGVGEALAPSIASWKELVAGLEGEAAEQRLLERALRYARADVNITDADWDSAIGSLSGEAYLAANKKSDKPPYSGLFGVVTAQKAKRLGPAKATSFGAGIVEKAKALGHERLGTATIAVEAANAALAEAHQGRVAAESALAVFGVRDHQRRSRIEALIAATEIEILRAFPGRDDLVRGVLSPWK
jgi:hypothetical protein